MEDLRSSVGAKALSQNIAREMVEKLDRDQDGRVSKQELRSFLQRVIALTTAAADTHLPHSYLLHHLDCKHMGIAAISITFIMYIHSLFVTIVSRVR